MLNLLNAEKPIAQYNNTPPPTVFVRKGQYNNGALDLQIVNTNGTASVNLDAGYRITETSNFETMSNTLTLGGQYITDLTVHTGGLFDIGFRIGDGIATPDDLFMSDGPWGIDDTQEGTTVGLYHVTENNFDFEATDFPIERNIELRATTNTYVAAYRSLTPRFKATDLSDFSSLKLSASGTGNVEVVLVKQGITNWEDQYKKTITLNNTSQEFVLPFADFMSVSDSNPVFDDVVTIVFTMASEDGSSVTKVMNLENLRLSQNNALSIDEYETETNGLAAYPNPVKSSATINFNIAQNEAITFVVYDQLGKQVYHRSFEASAGKNAIVFNREGLSSGLYFCKILNKQQSYNPLKLIID